MQLQRGMKLFCLTALAAMTVILLEYMFIIQPQKSETLLNRQAGAELKQRQRVVAEFYDRHTEPDSYAKFLQSREAVTDKMLPDHLNVSNYMLELQGKAAKAGVMLKQVKPEKITTAGNYVSQELVIAVEADYYQLYDFLCLIEQNERFAAIKDLKVRASNTAPLLECNAHLLVFAVKE